MTKRSFALAPVFACTVILSSGAWSYKDASPPPSVQASAASQPLELEATVQLRGRDLLDQAMARLDPSLHPWLRVTLWQRWIDEVVDLEAEGLLLRGPRQCARLEWTVRTGSRSSKVLVVSDGVALAHVVHDRDLGVKPTSKLLARPGNMDVTLSEAAERQLEEHGCGGPFATLRAARDTWQSLEAASGRWGERQVLCVSGTLPEKIAPALARQPKHGRLLLDPTSLQPLRVEWWLTADAAAPASPAFQLEFREWEQDRPLSHEDCAKLFSYQPTP